MTPQTIPSAANFQRAGDNCSCMCHLGSHVQQFFRPCPQESATASGWSFCGGKKKTMDTKRPKVLQFGSAMFALMFINLQQRKRSEAFFKISLSSHWPFIDVHCEAAMIVLARRFSPLLLLVAVGCGVIVWRPGPAGCH